LGWGYGLSIDRTPLTRIASSDAIRPLPMGEVKQAASRADSTKSHPALEIDCVRIIRPITRKAFWDDRCIAFRTPGSNSKALE
jgi:hypothetical protein